MRVDLAEAGSHLGELVDEVRSGTEVVITRNGQPVARLVSAAVEAGADRVPGSAKGLFTVPDGFDAPLEDFQDYI
jgi:prevent-host-death family protein